MDNYQWNENEPLSEINVTPFVDVLLVLLIIFMITAPIINQVVKVDLPQDNYSKDKINKSKKTLKISLNKDGIIFIDNLKIGLMTKNKNKFIQELIKWKENKNDFDTVDIIADKNVNYGKLIPIIARLKELGINLNLIIEPLKQN